MIHENDSAHPVGAYGQQTTTGETLLMKYASMNMAAMLGNCGVSDNPEYLANLANCATKAAAATIKALNQI